MSINKFENTFYNKAIGFVMVFMIVFYNNETFPSINIKMYVESSIILLALYTTIFLLLIMCRNIKISLSTLIGGMLLILLVLITMSLSSDYIQGYYKIIISIAIGIIISNIVKYDVFIENYISIIVFLAAYSLIVTYIIRIVTFSLPAEIFPRFSNSADLELIDARFSVVVDRFNYYRNFGIYREPGVYQVFLNLALSFELFSVKRKVSFINFAILSSTIISTFSTPGVIVLFLLIIIYVTQHHQKQIYVKLNRRKIIFIGVAFATLMIGLYYSNADFRNLFQTTFNKLTNKESSFSIRVIAVVANLVAWANSPIFGNGLTKGLLELSLGFLEKNKFYSTTHNTSTTGAMLNVFGLVFTFIHTTLLFRAITVRQSNTIVKLLIMIAILMSINTQLLIYNELIYIFAIYGSKNTIISIGHKYKLQNVNKGNNHE